MLLFSARRRFSWERAHLSGILDFLYQYMIIVEQLVMAIVSCASKKFVHVYFCRHLKIFFLFLLLPGVMVEYN